MNLRIYRLAHPVAWYTEYLLSDVTANGTLLAFSARVHLLTISSSRLVSSDFRITDCSGFVLEGRC
jgi:hypothetical protein